MIENIETFNNDYPHTSKLLDIESFFLANLTLKVYIELFVTQSEDLMLLPTLSTMTINNIINL
jgi:hypothetical protein